MRFRILGPLEVWDDHRQLSIGGPQQRALLAVLLLHANRVVSADRLIGHLWGVNAPANARSLLQGRIAEFRRVIRADNPGAGQRLVTQPPGYLLAVRPGELDLDRFTELVGAARRLVGPDLQRAAALFREALALWRGAPLDGTTLELCRTEASRLEEHQLSVLEERIEADLRLGRCTETVAELQTLVRAHPLREGLWARLMRALSGAGRRADALAAYRELRATLVEQLGVEPGTTLQQLHRDILTGAGPEPGPPAARVTPHEAVPAQLPPAIVPFTGRTPQLRQLDKLLDRTTQGSVPIGVISGGPGVGKTTLAVHWAHRVRHHFADGQLYVDLRGFHPSRPPMSPAEAIRSLLTALRAPPPQPTATLDTHAMRYRSVLSSHRLLLLLDNARDADQVRPLLPGMPGSLVLVTSRHQLTGLIAREGAHLLNLDLLTATEARDLLSLRLGPDRVTAEPHAVATIITGCAGLPLALSVLAARAAARPDFLLAALAGDLQDPRTALDALTSGDPAADIRTAFSSSFLALSHGSAQLLRLISRHLDPDLTVPAVARLAGMPESRVRPLLAELTSMHLFKEHAPGRYTTNALLRAYAIEQALPGEVAIHPV